MHPSLFLLLLLFYHPSLGLIITHENGTSVIFESLYSTIGPVDIPSIPYPVAFLRNENTTKCTTAFLTQFSPLLSSRFLIYLDPLFVDSAFPECTNWYFDSSGNAIYLAKLVQAAGAVGLVSLGADYEEYYDSRIAGVSDDVKIPYLVIKKETLQYLVENQNSIAFVTPPLISDKDRSLLNSLRRTTIGFNLVCCTLWPLLVLITGYCTYLDTKTYLALPRDIRSSHPILTKVVPCVAAIISSIYNLGDPSSAYNAYPKFPSLLFFTLHMSFCFFTFLLLLKTWIIATQGIQSARVFKFSIIAVDVFIGMMVILGVPWAIFVTPQIGTVSGVSTGLICMVGYIYFGKDVAVTIFRGDSTHKSIRNYGGSNISLKILFILFTVVFAASFIVCVIFLISSIMGSLLRTTVMDIIFSTALIITYSVFLIRKITTPNLPPGSNNNSSQEKLNDELQEKSQDSWKEKSQD